jgi:hypothetical protein
MAQIKDIDAKLAYYRRSANEAERNAKSAGDPDMELAYLAIARTWVYLAEELEREMALSGGPIIQPDEVFVSPARDNAPYKTR